MKPRSCVLPRLRALIARFRFGRSKPCTKTCGGPRNRRAAMSARVAASAVAVNATVWMPPSRSCSDESVRYSGRKSWPHREKAELRALEERDGFGLGKPLRCHIDEPQLAALNLLDRVAILAGVIGGIERRGGDAVPLERCHLIAHQRDER